jgi:hypothetical protein
VSQQHVFGREGYGFCDINSNVEYFDYADAGDTSNWSPAIVLSNSATSVKIARTTNDGIWTLTQTIMQVAATSSVKVTMTLKNNTAVSREVQLSRFADIDADGTAANTVDATLNDAMIFNSVGRGGSFGLALQNVGTSPFTYLGFVQNTWLTLRLARPSHTRPSDHWWEQTVGGYDLRNHEDSERCVEDGDRRLQRLCMNLLAWTPPASQGAGFFIFTASATPGPERAITLITMSALIGHRYRSRAASRSKIAAARRTKFVAAIYAALALRTNGI